jgi:phage terminase small subunit
VREYVEAGCKNAKQAAIRAGYAGGASAEVTASRLIRNPRIAAEIENAQGRLLRRHEISTDRVMSETASIAFFNLTECFDDKWALLPLRRIPKRARQAISRLEFKDGKPSKLIFGDKLEALKILIDYLGIFKLPPNPPPAPPTEEERLSVEEFRRRAGVEHESNVPPPDEE